MAAAEEFLALSLAERVGRDGFVRLRPAEMAASLQVPAAALGAFAASWERLETDGFMADGGRYRLRRHANFLATSGGAPQDGLASPRQGNLAAPREGSLAAPRGTLAAPRRGNLAAPRRGLHRPHFQASVHNTLNGGVDRWFAPVEDAVVHNPATSALLAMGGEAAAALQPGKTWFIEMHQFRIEALPGAPGYPTPEGTHHDGVDYVLIAMINRRNLTGGQTLVADNAGAERFRTTLDGLLDTIFLDDSRVLHGVTPIEPTDPALPSRRDVLVVTWKAV